MGLLVIGCKGTKKFAYTQIFVHNFALFFFQLCDESVADVVAELLADVLTPALRHGDTGGLIVDATEFGVDVTGIEIISGSDSTDGIDLSDRIGFATFRSIDANGSCSVR